MTMKEYPYKHESEEAMTTPEDNKPKASPEQIAQWKKEAEQTFSSLRNGYPFAMMTDTESAICALQEARREGYLAGRQAAFDEYNDKWVNVKKELPPINQSVIGYTNKGRRLIVWVDAGTLEFDEQDISYDEGERYTYWQPLPQPPQK